MNGQTILICVLVVGLLLIPMVGSGPYPASAADFDNDGYADLAIGVEWETIGDADNAGAVNVLYGSGVGISPANDQFWIQDDLVTDGSKDYDNLGKTLAAGDFDGNGAADLAVGVADEDRGTLVNVGTVHILYGSSPEGLVSTGVQIWHQGILGV